MPGFPIVSAMVTLRPRRIISTGALALTLLAPAPAAGSSFDDIYTQYQHDGGLVTCAYSRQELLLALRGIPADIEAYDPGFEQSLSEALIARGNGCSAFNRAASTQAPTLPNNGAAVADDGSPGPSTFHFSGSPLRTDDSTSGVPVPLSLAALGLLGATLMGVGYAVGLGAPPGLRRGSRSSAWTPRERLADRIWVLRDRLGR